MSTVDPLFGMHAQSLDFQRRRMEVLAANIANADTPGYLAKDLDFDRALSMAAQPSATVHTTQAGHLPGAATTTAQAGSVYRLPSQPSVDGNTVELQVEQAKFADAALHYKASLSFLDSKLRTLMTAITGQ